MKKFSLVLYILLVLTLLGCRAPDPSPNSPDRSEPPMNEQTQVSVDPTVGNDSEEIPVPAADPFEGMLPPALGDGPDGPVAVIYTDYYRLKAPISWGNTCLSKVSPLGNGAYSLSIYEHDSYVAIGGGKLCTLMMLPTDDDTYKDFPDYELLCALDTPEGSFYVVALFPTDVQFSEETADTYNAMAEELMDVLYSLKPVGDIEMAMA